MADPRGWGRSAHTDQSFLNFMQFFDKSGKFVCWRPPPGGLAPPPTGNPGSAPEYFPFHKQSYYTVAKMYGFVCNPGELSSLMQLTNDASRHKF